MATGTLSFPGVDIPIRCIATRTIGARPDIAILFAVPQAGTPDTSGTATLSFGFNGATVNWGNCLLDRGTLQVATTGQIQVFEIKDRRWRWQKAYYTGGFNVRNPDGTIDTSTQKTIAQIAALLFTEMGEPTADVSAITSTEPVEFILDHDNCADAIEELLNPRGYVISLNTDDSVTVNVRGTGATLPANDDVVSVSISLNPPEIPLYLTVVGDKTLVQSKLKCQAVGLDVDGTIKPVNSLSYMPIGGWNGTDLNAFATITPVLAQQCALRSVGRWYQAISQADGTQNVNYGGTNYCPGEISVSSAWQYLPLDDELLDTFVDYFGKKQSSPAYVEGTFYNTTQQANPPLNANTPAFTRVDRRDWNLQKRLGIVMFAQPALKKTPGPVAGILTFADVYLTCSYSVHDLGVQVKDRYVRSRNLGGIGQDLNKIDELQRQITLAYASNSSTVNGINDNASTVDPLADAYLDAAQNKYVTAQANLLLYRGIYTFNTDGVALQIRWDVAIEGSSSPFGTHVAQNFEGIPLLPTERERKLLRRTRMSQNPTNRRNRNFHHSRRHP